MHCPRPVFHLHAVVINGDAKYRHYLGTEEDEAAAKRRANEAVCAFANYAYIRRFGSGTIYLFIQRDYGEQPLDPAKHLQAQPLPSTR